MGKLFWKIMFCFWFAMIPMGIGIAWSIVELMSEAPTDRRRFLLHRNLHNNVRALALVLEHSGESAAKRFLTDLNGLPPVLPPGPPHSVDLPDSTEQINKRQQPYSSRRRMHLNDRKPGGFQGMRGHPLPGAVSWDIMVLDTQGIDLLQRPVPQWALHNSALAVDRLTQTVIASSGAQYSVVARVLQRLPQAPDRRRWLSFKLMNDLLNHPRQLGIRLIAGIVLSSLVCFLLSWYLTQPVKKLRAATRRLSAGNFDIRVAQAIGARNDELAELGWEFDHMADRIQALIASEQNLLNDVSHEFRSPLARLQVAVGLARHKAPDTLIPEVTRMEREIQRLDDLVGQVLMLSRLDANAMEGCHDYVDLPALLEDVARDAEFEASSRGRSIRIVDNLHDCTLKANVSLLHSALENVIRNAVKYTHEGTTVELSLTRDQHKPDWLQIEVCDQGNGVPEAMLDKLFDPFFRVETARDRDSGGYGLGLAIAQRAIRVHGGEIAAHNHNKGGLSVILRLPFDKA